MKLHKTSTTKRWLQAIDRGTLVTMNPPRLYGTPTLPRGADHPAAADTARTGQPAAGDNYAVNANNDSTASTTEIDRELDVLHEAAVWQLNAAIESGWDDAALSIAESYAADERSLVSRLRRGRAAA